MKLKSVSPLSKPEWKSFGSKSRWDIIAAMRGPDWKDSRSGLLKWHMNAVIRQRMWGLLKPDGGSAAKNESYPFVTVTSGLNNVGSFDFGHYQQHVIEAAHLLSIPVFEVTPGHFDMLICAGGVGNSIETLNSLIQAGKISLAYTPTAVKEVFGG